MFLLVSRGRQKKSHSPEREKDVIKSNQRILHVYPVKLEKASRERLS